jgi:ribosomal protein S1
MNQFIIKNMVDYRIRVTKKQCDNPKSLYTIEFAQETIKEGKVTNVSTYNLFLNETEIDLLIQGLK